MRERPICLLLLVLLVPSAALGHAGEAHPDGIVEPAQDPDAALAPPTRGYTGPGREPYVSFFQGAWLYGQAAATPLGDQVPRGIVGSGEWLVWEDANRSDIYAYHIPAGAGFYVTSDRAIQRNPAIAGNVVVWEDYRDGYRADIYAYFLDTAETRRVSTGPGSHRNPSIHGDLVAWEDDRAGSRDIWAARLGGGPEFPIAATDDRETDPLVLDGIVYYRTYRFNVWDIRAHDARRNETFDVTSDLESNGRPFTNGRHVLFLSQFHTAWTLKRYDPQRDRVTDTSLGFQDTTRTAVEGDRLLVAVRDITGLAQLVARNVTSGTNTHVSGNLALTTEPHLQDGTAYAAARTANGTSLLQLRVSPFAWGAQPRLTVTSPGAIASWLRPVTLTGILTTGPGWTEPATFTVSIDGGPPQTIAPAERWQTTLDPNGYEPGAHRVVVRATFREGPPVAAVLHLVVPVPLRYLDVEEAGPAYHAARLAATFDQYIGNNPGAYLILPLLLVLIALVVIRVWIRLRERRQRPVVEYVPPE